MILVYDDMVDTQMPVYIQQNYYNYHCVLGNCCQRFKLHCDIDPPAGGREKPRGYSSRSIILRNHTTIVHTHILTHYQPNHFAPCLVK